MLGLSLWANRIRRRSTGQTTVLVAAGSFVLLGCVGLAADVGSLRNVRQHMQSAADSAAIAAVQGMESSQDTAQSNAIADATTNGFTDGANGISVAVENPPKGGSFVGNANYERVVISQPQPTRFMRLLGLDTVNVSVSAAAHLGNSPYCIYVLDPSASGAFGGTMKGSGGASLVAKCGIVVDSNSSSAVDATGGLTLVQATVIGIVGNYTIAGGAVMTPTPKTGIVPSDDPLKNLVEPTADETKCLDGTNVNSDTTPDLYPGTYCGGIKISGNSSVTMHPGVYILDGGGMNLTGGSNLTGTGVTIYNTFDNSQKYGAYQPIVITGSGTMDLSAPTSEPYEGILFMADRNIDPTSTGSDIEGGSGSVYNGVLYFPTTSLKFSGNSSTSGSYTTLVCDRLTLTGSSQLNDNYSMLADGSPIKGAALAE